MKIIYWGLMFESNYLNKSFSFVRNGAVQMAPHVFQSNLLHGFSRNNVDVNIINITPVGSFPVNYKRLFVDQINYENKHTQIGYLNLPYIKHKIQERKLIDITRKFLLKFKNDDVYILFYHFYMPFLNAMGKLKKEFNNLKFCLISTDCVPGRGDMAKYMTEKAIKRGNKIVEKCKLVDKFVLLTEPMKDTLEIKDKPYLIVECIANETIALSKKTQGNRNICIYSGSIDSEFGIIEMINAFKKMPNAELWIFGKGDSESYIKEQTKKFTNIKYFGFVSKEKLNEFIDTCDYLINPRKPTGTYTKYSFPSKTAEYMMTGKPVIMYKLEGIPDEYDEFLNYLSLGKDIHTEFERIFSLDYTILQNKAARGIHFMKQNKSSIKQAKKIYDFLKGDDYYGS